MLQTMNPEALLKTPNEAMIIRKWKKIGLQVKGFSGIFIVGSIFYDGFCKVGRLLLLLLGRGG